MIRSMSGNSGQKSIVNRLFLNQGRFIARITGIFYEKDARPDEVRLPPKLLGPIGNG